MTVPSPNRRWRRRLGRVGFALALLLLALEAYVRWPSGAPAVPVAVAPPTRELVLIVHGSFGAEEPTLLALERLLRERSRAAGRDDVQVQRYRWAPWSDDILRAGPHGVRIGAELGRQLAAVHGPTRLHLIAHSAGAYLLDPLCEAWRAARAPGRDAAAVDAGDAAAVHVKMTFLDPIGLRGLFERGWGAATFGRCADEAEAYINTDDPAPATDRVLRHARTVDVTAAPGRHGSADGHRWPVRYYLERVAGGAGPPAIAR